MAGNVFVVKSLGQSVTQARDLISVLAGATNPLILLSARISIRSFTATEKLQFSIRYGNTTVGSGGAAFTPIPLAVGGSAAAFAARVNDTTPASAGSPLAPFPVEWDLDKNALILDFIFTEQEQIYLPAGSTSRLCLGIDAAPAAAVVISASASFMEI